MKKNTSEIGTYYERYAVQRLEEDGYVILDTNFQYGGYEIDIVAKKQKIVAFIEVKARNADWPFAPEDAINIKKMLHIYRAALGYKKRLEALKISTAKLHFRFDAIAISFGKGGEVLRYQHIADFFKSDEI